MLIALGAGLLAQLVLWAGLSRIARHTLSLPAAWLGGYAASIATAHWLDATVSAAAALWTAFALLWLAYVQGFFALRESITLRLLTQIDSLPSSIPSAKGRDLTELSTALSRQLEGRIQTLIDESFIRRVEGDLYALGPKGVGLGRLARFGKGLLGLSQGG